MIADFMFSLSLVNECSLLNFKVLYKLFLFVLRLSCALAGPAPFLRLLVWAWLSKLHYLPGTRAKKEGLSPLNQVYIVSCFLAQAVSI